jgi:hypothetical protein
MGRSRRPPVPHPPPVPPPWPVRKRPPAEAAEETKTWRSIPD